MMKKNPPSRTSTPPFQGGWTFSSPSEKKEYREAGRGLMINLHI